MSSSDNVTITLHVALLSKLETQTTNLSLGVADRSETTASVRSLRWLTKVLNQWATQRDAHNNVLLQLERSIIGDPELNEQHLWSRALANRANIGAIHGGYPGEQYLEQRKIFLPQGATLVLLHWQDELDEFVDEVEQVSGSSGAWLMTGRCR